MLYAIIASLLNSLLLTDNMGLVLVSTQRYRMHTKPTVWCAIYLHGSRGITSSTPVGFTERAINDVFSLDILWFPFVIVYTDSYSRILYGIGISTI
jgi:hypothetical protein